MIRSFIFSQGKLVSQDVGMDVLRLVLYDEGVHIWVDMENPSDEENKSVLEGLFNFHPLAIEDCIAVTERPKVDDYGDYIFMVVHAVDYRNASHKFCTTELNMFIGKNFLVTVHNEPVKSVQTTIDRVQKNAPLIAKAPDRLTYNLLNALLDNYEPALEELSSEITALEGRMLSNPSVDALSALQELKEEVQHLRQILSPQREVIGRLAHGEFKVVRAHLLPYYRDLSDHLSRISDRAESYRESLVSVFQLHLNLQQMQVNRVIKVLTVLATLSMPALLITSFYGMNINHIPNTEGPSWGWDYLAVFGITVFFTALVYGLLKNRKWM